MAYIYGRPGMHDPVTAKVRRKDILLRIALPLLFLFILASAGLHAFQHSSYVLTALFVVFFVFLLLRFEELGLTLAMRLSGGEAKARADQVVAKTLRLLPDEYHVFHGLDAGGVHIDHAVVGPNGFFLISTKAHLGMVTESRESLRLNGWPFLVDVIGQIWSTSKALLRRLDLQDSGAVQISPILCFSRGSVETGRLVRGVMIAQASTLARMILEHESPLSSEKVMRLTDTLTPLVRAGTDVIEATHMDQQGTGVPMHASRPACGKCRHIPSDLEAELFPGECPRCGRLYSAVIEEESPAATPAALRPSAAPLAAACLIVASGAALLTFQAGLFGPEQPPVAPATQPAAEDAPTVPTAGQASTPKAMPVPEGASGTGVGQAEATGRAAERTKPGQGSAPQPAPVTPVERQGTVAAPPADGSPDDSTNRTAAAPQPPNPAAALEPTGATGGQTEQAPQAARRSPVGLSPEGTLTIVTARPVTLWLTNDQTFKRFGPYRTNPGKALDIVLPKGGYTVTLVDNGRRRQTTVSFLSDTGRLEF